MTFDEVEQWRIARVRLALALHVPPSVVDEMPLADVADMIAVMSADKAYAQLKR